MFTFAKPEAVFSLGGVFDSAQSWHDNAFLKLPNFRDRVAEIWLTPEEGGLNLNMSPDTIYRLVARGREAGQDLVARFADLGPDDPMSWSGHRWARFRSGMAGFLRFRLGFRHAADVSSPGAESLEDLLATSSAPPTYKFDSEEQRVAARKITEELLEFLHEAELAASGSSDPSDTSTGPFYDGPRPFVDIGGARGSDGPCDGGLIDLCFRHRDSLCEPRYLFTNSPKWEGVLAAN